MDALAILEPISINDKYVGFDSADKPSTIPQNH